MPGLASSPVSIRPAESPGCSASPSAATPTARANAAPSAVRVRIEHVYARQKDQMALFFRTIGIARAGTKITLAYLAYNMDRLAFHERRTAMK